MPAPMACCLLQRAVSIALLPAPVACCLPRWPVACSNAAVSIALLPAPVACCLPRCWPAFARDRAGLVGAPGRSSVMRSAVVRAGARAVLQAKSRSRREAPACRVDVRAVLHVVRDDGEAVNSPIGLVFGLFCMRSGTFKGISSLCKCDNAYKVWWCWESRAAVQSSPSAADADPGIAVKAAHGAPGLVRAGAARYRWELGPVPLPDPGRGRASVGDCRRRDPRRWFPVRRIGVGKHPLG